MATNKIEFESEARKLMVVKPSRKDEKDAEIEYAKVHTDLLRKGFLLEVEVEKVARERKLWDDFRQGEVKRINKELVDSERMLAGRVEGATLDDKRKAALKMFALRAELSDLRSSLTSLSDDTAEAKARQAKFTFLLCRCYKFAETGKQVYSNPDDYLERSEADKAVGEAEIALAKVRVDYDPDWQKKLPEYKFLLRNKMCDESGRLIDPQGKFVDVEGKRVNEKGQLINEEGVAVNVYGDEIDEDGFIVPVEEPAVAA